MIEDNIKILGVEISTASKGEVLEEVRKWLKNGGMKHCIVTPNPEVLVSAQKDKEFTQILNDADLALPDGIGVVLAAKFLGRKISERITGVDLMQNLCQMAQKEGFIIGLIGGGPGVAVKTTECLQKMYPKLKVVLAQEEWTTDDRRWRIENSSSKIEDGDLINFQSSTLKIRSSTFHYPPSNIDILFVAFGAPKQEKWINENLPKLPVKVAMGVGGSFDYISGIVPRAPKWVQNLGLEWLYRLIRQPWRLKRQLALLKFVYLILQERFGRIEKYL